MKSGKSKDTKNEKRGDKTDGRGKERDLRPDAQPPGEFMTTNQGLRVVTDQDSLKAGVRGPTLLEDFYFREKITHFDNERIPERVVHARGAAAHGYFQVHKSLADITKAGLFQDPSKKTPVFVRFSTVAGSRGSADTPRDVRGFAIKFYTDEGVWDLVGNNIPIFFIQDAVKFPDLIHAVKPEPHNEIPQAASAHDTFYDFASLTPELTHMLMWVMSDRALPRSFSMMQGFGIHTFRMINARGKSVFVKFHFKPVKGVFSLVWDEAQKIAGKDADFNRRDLFESIEKGDFPEWEMGLQIVPEADEHKFDFDLLDPTKIIPEEEVPVRPIGKLVLNRNVDNYFSETEQVAFHPGHIVPGIDFSNDPLLQGRLFSYLDTQLKRVGPNFAQIPINRPTCPFSNNQRDGESQQLVFKGKVAYFPNSMAAGCPAQSPEGMAAFSSYAEKMDGAKVRQRSPSFGDHFSQATLFWNSMADWEKKHIVDALSFELNNVQTREIRERVVNGLLVNVADELAQKVAKNIGVQVTAKPKNKPHNRTSPALSMDVKADDIKGRKVAILGGDGMNARQVNEMKKKLKAEGAMGELIGPTAAPIKADDGSEIAPDRPAPNAASVIYDAVFIPDGDHIDSLLGFGGAIHFVAEAFAHCKTIAALGRGVELLEKTQTGNGGSDGETAPGIITAATDRDLRGFIQDFFEAMKQHRHHAREFFGVPA